MRWRASMTASGVCPKATFLRGGQARCAITICSPSTRLRFPAVRHLAVDAANRKCHPKNMNKGILFLAAAVALTARTEELPAFGNAQLVERIDCAKTDSGFI